MQSIRFRPLIMTILLTVAATTAHARIDRPFFYSVEKNGRTSHVLGSLHFGIGLHELPSNVSEKIKAARIVLSEITLSPEELRTWKEDPVQSMIMETAKYPLNGALLGEEERQILRSKWNLPEPLVQLARTHSCGIAFFHLFSLPQLDVEVSELAQQAGRSMKALDTIALRVAADHADEAATGPCSVAQLIRTTTPTDYSNLVVQENAKYRMGVESLMADDSPGLRMRNQAWINELTSEATAGDAFVVVGIGHLFGPNGLLQLLRDRGFNVQRVGP